MMLTNPLLARSPASKRTLKPAPPMASNPADISLLGMTSQSLPPNLTVSDPSVQLGVHGFGQPNPGPTQQQQQQSQQQNPRKRRASGQHPVLAPANIAPAPQVGAQYGAPQQMQNPGQIDPQGQPAAKKGRTNTPWTPAEEQRLKQMRDQGKSWSEIAKTFPNRTEGSVKKHWYKVCYPATPLVVVCVFVCFNCSSLYMRQGSQNFTRYSYRSLIAHQLSFI